MKLEKEQADRAKLEAEERARRAEQEAKEKAEREVAEKERIAREAAERREADKAHRAKINNAALQAFVENGLDETVGKAVIEMIARKMIPNVSISY